MKTIADARVLDELVGRLGALRPDTPRRWGRMTPGEMLCHLGDVAANVLEGAEGSAARAGVLRKWIALYTPVPWPRGLPTPPEVDPRSGGTRPGDFERDRRRAVDGLRGLAAAPAHRFPVWHSQLGQMTARDWRRWAYRHTDHHLRQFGL